MLVCTAESELSALMFVQPQMAKSGHTLTAAEADAIMAMVDTDGSGGIDMEEFMDKVRLVTQRS
jgi:Ca2+-binding EF-hand superfamily protein